MPQGVSAELRRVVERWQQLPLATAEASMPLVRLLVDALAGERGPVPDLGPGVVMDQLMVLVHDVCAASPTAGAWPPAAGAWSPAAGAGSPAAGADPAYRLEGRLADLRRAL